MHGSMTVLSARFFKISRLSTILTALAISLFVAPSYGIRFNMEDDGSGRQRTVYPEAVRNVAKRSEEVQALIKASPLAGNFPYLHLTDLVKREDSLKAYLSVTAEVLISQAEPDLQLPLRKMYFEGIGVVESSDVWVALGGRRLFRATLAHAGSPFPVRLEVIPGIEQSSHVMRLIKLMAIAEVIHNEFAKRYFATKELRLIFPVVDMVSKIASALLIEETLDRMGVERLQSEIARFEINSAMRATLFETFSRSHLQTQAKSWLLENFEIRSQQLKDWVELARQQRGLRNKSITGLSSIDSQMDRLVNLELSAEMERDPGRQFLMARMAKEQGDERKLNLIKSQFRIISAGGRCDLAFVPQ
jgi:hypothetical protein